MFLARTLGRTLEELGDSMSAAEFGDWMALYAIEADEAANRTGAGAEPVVEEMDVREFLRRTCKHG